MMMKEDSDIRLRVTGDQGLAEEWELVLLAQGLSPSVRRSADGVVLCVPERRWTGRMLPFRHTRVRTR